MPKKAKVGSRGSSKYSRNIDKCKRYRLENRREKNKKRRKLKRERRLAKRQHRREISLSKISKQGG